jgi:hypothetical protein
MPILNRTKAIKPASAAERAFDRYVKRATQLLAEQPCLRENQLAHLLAAEEGATAFDTICASECAFARRGWLSDSRTRPDYAQNQARRVA